MYCRCSCSCGCSWWSVVSCSVVSCGVVSVVSVRIAEQAHFSTLRSHRSLSTHSASRLFYLFRAPASSFFWPFLFSDLLASSLLFSDSSRLCFSICPSCKKFDFETSFACIHFWCSVAMRKHKKTSDETRLRTCTSVRWSLSFPQTWTSSVQGLAAEGVALW